MHVRGQTASHGDKTTRPGAPSAPTKLEMLSALLSQEKCPSMLVHAKSHGFSSLPSHIKDTQHLILFSRAGFLPMAWYRFQGSSGHLLRGENELVRPLLLACVGQQNQP